MSQSLHPDMSFQPLCDLELCTSSVRQLHRDRAWISQFGCMWLTDEWIFGDSQRFFPTPIVQGTPFYLPRSTCTKDSCPALDVGRSPQATDFRLHRTSKPKCDVYFFFTFSRTSGRSATDVCDASHSSFVGTATAHKFPDVARVAASGFSHLTTEQWHRGHT